MEHSQPILPNDQTRNVRIHGKNVLFPETPNSTSFFRAALRKCEFVVNEINVTPALDTLSIWQTEAFSQSRILNLLIEQYKLAKSFGSFISMSIADSLSLDDKLFGASGEITSRLADFDFTWKDITTAEGQLLLSVDMPAEWGTANDVYPELWD